MKNNTILFSLFVAFGLIFSTGAYAQDGNAAAKELTEKMKTSLSLTDDQYTKVEAINLEYTKSAAALKATKEAKMANADALKELGKKRKEALKSVLTEEQFKAFEAEEKAKKGDMKHKMKDKDHKKNKKQ